MSVVDASIVVRLLQNRRGDAELRERFAAERYLHAPALIDAEVTSAIRGLLRTTKPSVAISAERAEEMLADFGDLTLVRYAMQPFQRRALALRNNFTAYDAFYVALAESLDMQLLTDDGKYGRAAGHAADIETWPECG
ncbi:type II toxin-antitoxin system VapC family toxin [Pseudactinotalea sp. Z1732]|uniref:type II toxin-antitoxin system VapC family toxin n=1 Tax=Micrococcales TaxID=85006 RepID=UPI003C7A4666